MAHNQQVVFDTNNLGVATTTLTVAAGSNRILAIAISHEQGNTGRFIGSIDVGGQTATRKGYAQRGSGADYAFAEVWYLTESQVAALSANPSVTITNAAGGNLYYSGTLFQLNDADQTASNWPEATDSNTTTTPISVTLTTAANDMVVAAVACSSSAASFAPSGSLTETAGSDKAVNSAFRAASGYATASGVSTTVGGDINSSSGSTYQIIYAVSIPVYNANATISSATPTGNLTTQTQFTWGATTNTASGTAYLVANTDQSKITAATGPQVAAGHGNDDLAAPVTDSVAVASTTISDTKTGVSAGTTYYYAMVQVTGGSNYSNVAYGSFTTATATRKINPGLILYSAADTPLANTAVVVWTKNTRYGAAVDGGTDGIAVTTEANGELLDLTGLTIAAGDRYIQVGLPGGDDSSDHVYPANFVAES